jgi:hypothetical protein
MPDQGNRRSGDKSNVPREPNPMKQVTLNPVQLRSEPAREIPSQQIHARETPIVSYGDHASGAKPITEHRYDFSRVQELKPALREERSLKIELRPVLVTPVQMQKLRDRRAAARPIGWTIPGHTIRIGK